MQFIALQAPAPGFGGMEAVAAALGSAYPWMLVLVGSLVGLALLVLYFRRRAAAEQQEHLFSLIFERSTDPMVLTDDGLRIIEANPSACRLLSLSPNYSHHHRLDDVLEIHGTFEADQMPQQLLEGGASSFEARVEDEAGQPVDFNVRVSGFEADDDIYLLATFHDITALKEDLRLVRSFYRQALDHLPIEASILSPQGQYMYVNEKMGEDAEQRRELVGKTDVQYCQEFGLHPEIALRRRAHRKRAIAERRMVQFEETLPDASGGVRHYLRYFTPIIDRDDEIYAVVSYGVDRSTIRQAEEEIRVVKKETERVMRLKEAILDNISHEFRTPLSGILGAADVLREEIPEEKRDFVEMIEQSGRRLMSTLNTVLDLAKLHAEDLRLESRVLNMVEEVERVAQSLRPAVEEKNLFLRVRPVEPEILAWLDPSCLYRVLNNLIGNAVKFTESGGIVVEVDADDTQVHVRVIDSGVGIHNEFFPYLFHAFHQESAGTSRQFEGTGLGLTVTKRLLDLMEGTVTVHSDKGEGSMFSVSFRLAFPKQRDAWSSDLRVLIADRSSETLTLAQYMLAPHVDAMTATDLESLVTTARQETVDAVVLDVGLDDDYGGAELQMRLREVPGYEEVPIVAVDAQSLPGGREQFLASGYDAYLTKPLKKREVLDAVGAVLATKERQRRVEPAVSA